jgi:hypothetical protein
MNVSALLSAVRQDRVLWRRHALQRMLERGISRDQVKAVLRRHDVVTEYPEDRPFPSALFHGESTGERLHVVAALDEGGQEVHVITVYHPDTEHFKADGRTRRRP